MTQPPRNHPSLIAADAKNARPVRARVALAEPRRSWNGRSPTPLAPATELRAMLGRVRELESLAAAQLSAARATATAASIEAQRAQDRRTAATAMADGLVRLLELEPLAADGGGESGEGALAPSNPRGGTDGQ